LSTFLITGATGFLGAYLIEACRKYGVVNGLSRTPSTIASLRRMYTVDITDQRATVRAVAHCSPDVIIHAAALTDVDYCERWPNQAWTTNLIGTFNIACAANRIGARLTYVSTDSVFDGNKGNYSETDAPKPINTYSTTKAAAEAVITNLCKDFAIVRTNFFGLNRRGGGLLNWLVEKLRNSQQVPAFYDVVFSPLEAGNLSSAIAELGVSKYVGILHLGSQTPISKYLFACEVAETLGKDPTRLVKKISVDEAKLAAPRPKNTSLNSSLALSVLKVELQEIHEGIRNAVAAFNSS
jgi:dTDP-4-dehydrorhamnose reductase